MFVKLFKFSKSHSRFKPVQRLTAKRLVKQDTEEHSIVVAKQDDELRIVWGEVYVPGVPDSDGDYMSAEEIRKAAYNFMSNKRLDSIDVQHNNELVDGACVVESFIARKGDPDFKEGAWVAGVYVHDPAIWEQVKKGTLNGFSIEAGVNRTVVNASMEIPAVINGITQKSEDHQHAFFVSYTDDGKFRGGRTDEVNGHYHIIKRGTVTEAADNHQHRFAHVDTLGQLQEIGK